MVKTGDLILLGGAGTVGYRYYKGEWPWEADWWPWAPPIGGEIAVADVSVSPSTLEPGESFTIEARVENTGDEDGSETIVFTVNGNEIASPTVTIPAKQEKTVEVDHSIDEAGEYNACAEVE